MEGIGGREYRFTLRSPRRPGEANGIRIIESNGLDTELSVKFEGAAGEYVRREIVIPMSVK